MTTQPDWSEYLTQMTHLLDMELDAPRREELERSLPHRRHGAAADGLSPRRARRLRGVIKHD